MAFTYLMFLWKIKIHIFINSFPFAVSLSHCSSPYPLYFFPFLAQNLLLKQKHKEAGPAHGANKCIHPSSFKCNNKSSFSPATILQSYEFAAPSILLTNTYSRYEKSQCLWLLSTGHWRRLQLSGEDQNANALKIRLIFPNWKIKSEILCNWKKKN